ncbi:MAG: T9SS type A sorting domain-containing protein [Flavobacteriaceae bacterium]|jgi:hypothetical protein|nr:T9SS type A sorting domain-containing protein [Flavobacteriaceae bacterium]
MKKLVSILLLFIAFNLVTAETEPVFSSYSSEQTTTKSIIYPNPARDFTTIKNTSDVKIKNITVVSMVGSSVLNQNGGSDSEIQLNLTNIRAGRYFVRVTYANGYQEILSLIKL